jgi:mitochondrial fission protein ELM1
MQIILIDDNKSGHKSQLSGVYNYIDKEAQSIHFSIINSWLNYTSYFIFNLFASKRHKEKLKNLVDLKVSKIIIIAIGSRTLFSVIYLKKYILSLKKEVKLVYLMPSTKKTSLLKLIDLIFYHSYKPIPKDKSNKYYPILIAPHNVIEANLGKNIDKNNFFIKEMIQKIGQNKDKNMVGVLIGGDAKKISFNKLACDELIRQLELINQYKKCYYLISTSRRTDINIIKYLDNKLNKSNLNYYLYKYENNGSYNPYSTILNYANDFIISGESVSMISEVISLEKNKNVYIFFNKYFYAKRYEKFHIRLSAEGYIKNSLNIPNDYLNLTINNHTKTAINPAINMAKIIANL